MKQLPPLRLTLRQQQHLLQTLLLLILALPLSLGLWWWWGKHQSWQNSLERQEAIYARLLGMQAQQDDIAQTLQQASRHSALYLYPAQDEQKANANDALQQLRSALDRVGVQVSSSQVKVLPQDEAFNYQRLELLLNLEGKWSDIQLALAALRDIRPLLWIDKVQINLKTRLQSANNQVEQSLGVELVISIYKAREQS